MAFGDLRGSLAGFDKQVVSPVVASGSVVVQPQDLVVVVIAEAATNSVTAVTDNLGQVYTAINAGTISKVVVGSRAYYRVVTVAGTLTAISCVMTNSTSDYAISAAVFAGPFTSTPLDRSPVNAVDETSPFSCTPTGTLSQARELIFAGLALFRGQTVVTANTPLQLARNTASSSPNDVSSVSAALAWQIVNSTASVTPSFNASGSITGAIEIVASFRQGVYDRVAVGSALAVGSGLARGAKGIVRAGISLGSSAASARAFTDVRIAGTALGAGVGLGRGSHGVLGVGVALGSGAVSARAVIGALASGTASGTSLANANGFGAVGGAGAAVAKGAATSIATVEVGATGTALGAGAAGAVGGFYYGSVGIGVAKGTAISIAAVDVGATGVAAALGAAYGHSSEPFPKQIQLHGYLPGPVSTPRLRGAPGHHGVTPISATGYRVTTISLSGNLGVP